MKNPDQIPSPASPPAKPRLLIPLLIILALVSLSAAYLLYQNNRVKKQLVQIPAPMLPSSALTQEETADWKTYQDGQVSFIYPHDWEVQEPTVLGSRTAAEFKYKNTALFMVTHQANYHNGTGKPFSSLEEYLGTRSNLATEIKVDDLTAKLISAQGDGGQTISYKEMLVFTPSKSNIVSLYYRYPYYDRPETEHVFDQILATFRFLDNSITSVPAKKPTSTAIPIPSPTATPIPTAIPIPTLNARAGEEFSFTVPFDSAEGVESKSYYDSSYLQFLRSQVNEPGKSDTYETFYFRALRAGETTLEISRYRWPGNQEVKRFTYKVIVQS